MPTSQPTHTQDRLLKCSAAAAASPAAATAASAVCRTGLGDDTAVVPAIQSGDMAQTGNHLHMLHSMLLLAVEACTVRVAFLLSLHDVHSSCCGLRTVRPATLLVAQPAAAAAAARHGGCPL
jgi:hypothetical protein